VARKSTSLKINSATGKGPMKKPPTHNIVQCRLSRAADEMRIEGHHNQTAVYCLHWMWNGIGIGVYGLMGAPGINVAIMDSQCAAGRGRERCGNCCRWRAPRSARILAGPSRRPGRPASWAPRRVTDQQSCPVGSSP